MTEDEYKFAKEFGINLKGLMDYTRDTVSGIAEASYLSQNTIRRYMNAETIPNLSSVNNLVVGLGYDWDEIVTIPAHNPIDWTRDKKIESSIEGDDVWRIEGLQRSLLYFAEGAPTNMHIVNSARPMCGDLFITQSEYKEALSKGLKHMLTRSDGEGNRHMIETIEIFSKSLLIPKRDLYRYLDGTRTISTLHAFNILNFFKVRPQALLGNFKCFVIEDECL